jgi:hypothetical protein
MRLKNDRPRHLEPSTHTLAASGSPAPNNRASATTYSSFRAAITYSAAAAPTKQAFIYRVARHHT